MGESVEIRLGNDEMLRGYAAVPAPGGEKVPGVVVLHEIWGLNDDIRSVVDRFEAAGYAAVAPNLYSHGNKALCLTKVLSELRDLRDGQVARDIARTRSWLADQPAVDPDRVAIIGFCMGGGFALAAAAGGSFTAASVNYGAVPPKERLTRLCPVVASYGGDDRMFAKQGERLAQYLDELGIPHDTKIYEGAGHSFMTAGGGPRWMSRLPNPMSAGYAPEQAEDAWRRVFSFFDKYVKGQPTVAEERAGSRARGALPEEENAGVEVTERQAELILEDSEERTFDRSAAPDTHLEERTSEDTVAPE